MSFRCYPSVSDWKAFLNRLSRVQFTPGAPIFSGTYEGFADGRNTDCARNCAHKTKKYQKGSPITRRKVPQNAPCPCGSGEKYKRCCLRNGLRWKVGENGEAFRVLPLSGEMQEISQNQREVFVRKHGRALGPEDRVFEDLPHGEYLEHVMVETMKKVGIRPELVYAYEKTGRILTQENQRFLTDAELAEWQAALEEYRTGYEGQSGSR